MESRRVLITGICGGIGKATAETFQSNGWEVIGIDRAKQSELRHVDLFEVVDVSDSVEVRDFFTSLRSSIDGLNALVNNAAIQINKPIVQTTDEEWEQIMNTNLRAAFQCIREAHTFLKAEKGSVVNVSSVHAVATSPNVAAYAVSKAAMVALTRSSAVELAADGIRCNAVLPGAVDTSMLRDGLSRRPNPDGADGNLRLLAGQTPLGFVASPEQVSPSIFFLADNAQSGYTTGQSLILDGGATIKLSTE